MILRLFKIVFPLLACLFLGKLLFDYWPDIVATDWQLNWPLLALSLLLVIVVFLADAWGWWLILRASGEGISVAPAVAVWLRASLTRYVPGVVWAYLSRVVLAGEYGVSRRNCIDSIVIETAMLALGSFTIGLPVLLPALGLTGPFALLAGTVCVVAILFGLSQPGFALLRRLPRVGDYLHDSPFFHCRWRWWVYAYYCALWQFFALVFVVFLAGMSVDFPSSASLFEAAGAFAASFCIGLVLVVFPGGLGIREATLYGFLTGLLGPAVAIAVSLGSRLWLIAGELLSLATYMLGWVLRESRQQR